MIRQTFRHKPTGKFAQFSIYPNEYDDRREEVYVDLVDSPVDAEIRHVRNISIYELSRAQWFCSDGRLDQNEFEIVTVEFSCKVLEKN